MTREQLEKIRKINEYMGFIKGDDKEEYAIDGVSYSREAALQYLDEQRLGTVTIGMVGAQSFSIPVSEELIKDIFSGGRMYILLDPRTAKPPCRVPRYGDILGLHNDAKTVQYVYMITHVLTAENSAGMLSAGCVACSLALLYWGNIKQKEIDND